MNTEELKQALYEHARDERKAHDKTMLIVLLVVIGLLAFAVNSLVN